MLLVGKYAQITDYIVCQLNDSIQSDLVAYLTYKSSHGYSAPSHKAGILKPTVLALSSKFRVATIEKVTYSFSLPMI